MKKLENGLIDWNHYFPKLNFDEKSHTYKVGRTKLTSVSGVIKELHEPFDKLGQAKKYAKSRGFTLEQVLCAWDTENAVKTAVGSKVHNFAEDYIQAKFIDKTTPQLPTCKQELAVVQFMKVVEKTEYLEVVGIEVQMYNKDWRIAGTIDLVLLDTRTGNLVYVDWKTNAKLFSDFDNGVLDVVGLKNEAFSKYTVQFSLYTSLMEAGTPFKVDARRLIWLRPSTEKYNKNLYQSFSTPHLKEPLEQYLVDRLTKK